MREGKLTIVDSDKLYLWAEDAEDVVEVKLTPYIERKLKEYGYRWQWQPEIQWGILPHNSEGIGGDTGAVGVSVRGRRASSVPRRRAGVWVRGARERSRAGREAAAGGCYWPVVCSFYS